VAIARLWNPLKRSLKQWLPESQKPQEPSPQKSFYLVETSKFPNNPPKEGVYKINKLLAIEKA
jgi:hypothetical protein